MYPRLAFDISWRDLVSALSPAWSQPPPIQPRPADANAVIALSVRTAFDALLAELALPSGSEILMSAVNIAHMAEIVRAHDLVAVAVDIEIGTLAPTPASLAAAVGPASRIFLLAQLFGARTPLAPYADICAGHGLMLVEDAAQAFVGDLDLPDGADVSLYSFGPIKTATALGGAVAVVRDAGLAERLSRRLADYSPLGNGWFWSRVLKYAALKAMSHPAPYAAVVAVIKVLGRDPDVTIGSVARGFGQGDLFVRLRRRPPPAMVRLLIRRVTRTTDRLARRKRSGALLANLPRYIEIPGASAKAHTFWLTAILAPAPSSLIGRLRSRGFDATQGATSMRVLTGTRVAAPNAERLIETVVYLPITPWLPDRKLGRLAKSVSDAAVPT
jgi:perosamine synthetase